MDADSKTWFDFFELVMGEPVAFAIVAAVILFFFFCFSKIITTPLSAASSFLDVIKRELVEPENIVEKINIGTLLALVIFSFLILLSIITPTMLEYFTGYVSQNTNIIWLFVFMILCSISIFIYSPMLIVRTKKELKLLESMKSKIE